MGPFTFSEKQCKGQLLFLRGVLWCGPDTPGVIPYSDVRVVNRVEGTRPGGGEGGGVIKFKEEEKGYREVQKILYCYFKHIYIYFCVKHFVL